MIKIIITALISFILGGVIAALVFYPQIQNRYEIGKNAGKIQGGLEVVHFLENNVHNSQSNEKKDLKRYLPIKDVGISVVEIDGVETVIIIK